MFDCGQKIAVDSNGRIIDAEANHIIYRSVDVLINQYPEWKLSYVDECIRKGKLDEYDKGQRITMKRIEVWFATFAKAMKFSVWAHRKEELPGDYMLPEFAAKFAANAERFGAIVEFRQSYKPNFDDEEWTLVKIEQTPEFRRWIRQGYRDKKQSANLIFTKI